MYCHSSEVLLKVHTNIICLQQLTIACMDMDAFRTKLEREKNCVLIVQLNYSE